MTLAAIPKLDAKAVAEQILTAPQAPSLAQIALILEAIERRLEGAKVGTQAHDTLFYVEHARLTAADEDEAALPIFLRRQVA